MRCLCFLIALLQLFATLHLLPFATCNFCKSLCPNLEKGALELGYALVFFVFFLCFPLLQHFACFCNFCRFCLLPLLLPLPRLQILISQSRERCHGDGICAWFVVFCFILLFCHFLTFAIFAFCYCCSFCYFCHFCKS